MKTAALVAAIALAQAGLTSAILQSKSVIARTGDQD